MKKWSRISALFSGVIGILILGLLIYMSGWGHLGDILRQASVSILLLALVVYAGCWFWRTKRLYLFSQHANASLKRWQLFLMQISGFALNDLVPGRFGEVATITYLRMQGMRGSMALAMIVQSRILDLLTLIIFVFIVTTSFLSSGTPSWIWQTIIICAVISLLPYLFICLEKRYSLPRSIVGLVLKIKWPVVRYAREKIYNAYQAFTEIITDRTLFLQTFCLSVFIWIGEGLTCYIISIGIHAPQPFLLILLAVSLANIGKGIPATPGGIGVYEGVMVAVLSLGECPMEMALAIALLDHFGKKTFTLVLGLPATYQLVGFRWYIRLQRKSSNF